MLRQKNSVLIIEDDIAFSLKLEMNLAEWGYEVIGVFKSGEEALETIHREIPTVILMDIQLEGKLTGLDVAKKIADLSIDIIFMTAWKDESFFNAAKEKTGSVSYLVKPFDLLTLKGALEMARNNEKSNSTILLKRGQETFIVDRSSIIWIESDGNYSDIHTEQGRFTLKKSTVKILEELDSDKIIKVHRQYAVSIDRIRKVWLSKGELELKNGKILPLGRTYKKILMAVFKNNGAK